VLSTLGAAGGAIEQLHLRVLYLRRIHHFDYLGGGQFASHAALLSACGEGHFANRCVVHAASREPLAAPIVYAKGPGVAEVHVAYLGALGALDESFESAVVSASAAFYAENCVEEQPDTGSGGKFRCPLSGKLFKTSEFVRKHIENKHMDKVLIAKRAALEPKYLATFAAEVERAASMPPMPPPPQRFFREGDERRGGRRGDFEGGKGFGKGGGKGYGKGKGKGGKWDGEYGGSPFGKGGGGGRVASLEPPPGTAPIDRPVVTYRDLDAPDDDDLFA